MSTYKSIGEVAYKRPLAKLNMEELAARQHTLQRPSGGIEFARGADREEKRAARQHILDLFTRTRWPGNLHMLTMPGVQWRFERLLLGSRERGWFQQSRPRGTFFTSAENDRAIYTSAVSQMPGLHTPESHLRRLRDYPFAEQGVKTHYASFFFANIDDLMAFDWHGNSNNVRPFNGWDAVWLDYTGPLTSERLHLIRGFYDRAVKSTLIITALLARWNARTSEAIERAGGHSPWLREAFPGEEILFEIEYQDTVPMVQFAVRHRTPLWFWRDD